MVIIMNIFSHTAKEIEKMRIVCKLAAQVLEIISPYVKPGITTLELNEICHQYIVNKQKATPAPLNYHGFPKSICTSVNNVVCHGIPTSSKTLKHGDIINIDITVIKNGFYGDTSKMFLVGKTSIKAKRLVKLTQECLYLGIMKVHPGAKLSDIGKAIQEYAECAHYSIVREYCGHGIGRAFHEDPQILHYYDKHNIESNIEIKAGMTFTIEPMINEGKRHVKIMKDNWTVVTKDRKLSAQWEHTLLVTEDGCEVLTKREEETNLS